VYSPLGFNNHNDTTSRQLPHESQTGVTIARTS
jgi:hypothetical protein